MIRDVVFPSDIEALDCLIREYVSWLGIDLSYQDFEGEMKSMEALFSLPNGVYTFAIKEGLIAGGVGFKRIDSDTAEIKRLYVRPKFQSFGLGRKLMENLLNKLKYLGYTNVVLDAVPPTIKAQELYEKMGFYEIEPYFNNPTPDTKFYGFNIAEYNSGKNS